MTEIINPEILGGTTVAGTKIEIQLEGGGLIERDYGYEFLAYV